MRINNNLMAMNTHRQLGLTNAASSRSMEKLSSGYRINRAGDDAAGLAISEKMRGQIRGLDQASRNSQDSISLIQTAEGALSETHDILQRMRELATQAASDTNVEKDREEIQKEINQLTSEINRIGNSTEFNTKKLLDGGDARTAALEYTTDVAGITSAGSVTGEVSKVHVATTSIKAGTVVADSFATLVNSKVTADDGRIGSPLLTTTSSTLAGTGAMTAVTTVVEGGLGVVNDVQDVAAGVAAKGKDTYTVATNFAVGNTLTIDGQTFTAVAAGEGNTDSTFEVGADVNATAANIKLALEANTTITGTYAVTSGGAGTFTLETLVVNDGNAGASTENAGTSKSQYAFEITANFTAGDELAIGDETYVAGTDFTIGATIAESVANIKTAIEAANDSNDTAYDITTTDPTWTGSTDNNILVFTAKVAGVDANQADMEASAITPTLATAGEYKFEVKTNFEVGQALNVAGATLTAVEDDGVNVNSATQFLVGATIEETATNIKAALDAAKVAGTGDLADYTITIGAAGIDADTITFEELAASGDDTIFTDSVSITDVTAAKGKYSIEISTDFSVGDTIKIGDVTYTAGTATAGTTFKVGATTEDTVAELVKAIDAGGVYNASQEDSNFVDGNVLVVEEVTASGTDLTDMVETKVTEQRGVYEFLVTENFADQDEINVAGVKLQAGDDFVVGADANATATNIAAALDKALDGHFDVAAAAGKITLTEQVSKATGGTVTDPTVSKGSVAGEYTFELDAIAEDSYITIDGEKLTFTADFTATGAATELKSLIEANVTLNNDYTVSVTDAEVTLTQKTGSEDGPVISQTTAAGQGFTATMQIGANTGQSIALDIQDMRSAALGVSSDDAAVPASFTIDGQTYTVAWTATTDVENETSSEYALDVSSYENATAAIKVIDDAITTVSAERSKLGAFQNRLEHTIKNLNASGENLQASESRIRDVDMAKEMMQLSKNNILSQAATAMLAQANQAPEGVLQLLR